MQNVHGKVLEVGTQVTDLDFKVYFRLVILISRYSSD